MRDGGINVALLVAGGSGSRAGGGLPKQYRRVGGRAMLVHALVALRHPRIDAIRVVIGAGQEPDFREALDDLALPAFTIGGSSRLGSVRNGLEAIAAEGGAAHVLIHDAARPFLASGLVDRLLDALADTDGAVPVLPVVDTLAVGGARLGEAVPRDGLVRVQTPQAFRFASILAAHRAWSGGEASDDALVARAAGYSVATVAGDPMLEKITHEADFVRAAAMIGETFQYRTGYGCDVHAFGPGDTLWLGGVAIGFDRALRGHSDADVLLHALTDALLGAIGEGDIGDHFPPTDPRWRGAASHIFLEHARDLVLRGGGRIVNVDATIVCEAPRIGPHREAIRRSIAALLRLPPGSVSVKATTTERLGFAGRGEGIEARAVATVRVPEQR